MNASTKLVTIKIIHTIIWVFFNVVLFYLYYAIITNRIDQWVWFGLGSFLVEGIVLFFYKYSCPLTVWARHYSRSTRDNFDIYIPNWLAKYNKTIYTGLLGMVILILIYQLINR